MYLPFELPCLSMGKTVSPFKLLLQMSSLTTVLLSVLLCAELS